MLNVIDDCTRECLRIEVSTGFSGRHVTRVLERLCEQLGRPKVIRSDNGSEFTGIPPAEYARRLLIGESLGGNAKRNPSCGRAQSGLSN